MDRKKRPWKAKRIMAGFLALMLFFMTGMEGLAATPQGGSNPSSAPSQSAVTDNSDAPETDGNSTPGTEGSDAPEAGDTDHPVTDESGNPGEGDPDSPETNGNGNQEPNTPGTTEPGNPETQDPEDQEYTISFDTDGGKEVEPVKVKSGECLTKESAPTTEKVGYLFQYWAFEEETEYDYSQPVVSNLTLKAVWKPITYKIHFDANGGSGADMPDQEMVYDQEATLSLNQYVKEGYLFVGWATSDGALYEDGRSVKNLTDQDGAMVTLTAQWNLPILKKFTVQFDGNGATDGTMTDQIFVYGEAQKLLDNTYTRKGYTFKGWSLDPNATVRTYKDEQSVKNLTEEDGGIVILYAVWEGKPYFVHYDGNGATSGSMPDSSHVYGTPSPLTANQYAKTGYLFKNWNTKKDGSGKTYQNGESVTNLTSTKNKTVTLYAIYKIISYSLTYYTNGGDFPSSYRESYTIETKTFTLPKPEREGYDFDGWYKDSSLKKRVDTISQGSIGDRVFYAKWVKCSRKPTSTSAKVTYCKATGKNKVKVKATVKKRIASSDDYYYLLYTSPTTEKGYKMAARSYKKTKITFNLKASENQGYVVSKYRIGVKVDGKYVPISSVTYVKDFTKAASNRSAYKLGKTKKGIQYSNSMDEIYNCDAKNTFLNVTTSMVCNGTVPYVYNGKTYYFQDMASYQEIVMACNKKKINVTMQILLDWTANNEDLIASRARVKGAAPYYMWNISSNSAREKMEAIFCYLGKVFGQKNCYVSNWVLGNEVENPKDWTYRGSMSKTSYFRSYAVAFRSLYYAVRSQYSNARVFICMGYSWNVPMPGGFSVKTSIATIVKELNKLQKGIKWNLAYHAYSFPLTYTKVWEGRGVNDTVDSPYVTPKNLNVLTNYIKKTYGSSVRIILSEQGFSSTWGEANQAAALAYSYYAAACNPMVDAFIIRSYEDHPVEVAQGLSMGIYGKLAFKVFKYMDTKKSEKYTKPYLQYIGESSWKKAISGYRKSRTYKMYRK